MSTNLMNLLTELAEDDELNDDMGTPAFRERVRADVFQVLKSIKITDLRIKKRRIIQLVNEHIIRKMNKIEEEPNEMVGPSKTSRSKNEVTELKSHIVILESTINDLQARLANLEIQKQTDNKSTQVSVTKKYLKKSSKTPAPNTNDNCSKTSSNATLNNFNVSKCHLTKSKSMPETQYMDQRTMPRDAIRTTKSNQTVKRPSTISMPPKVETLKTKQVSHDTNLYSQCPYCKNMLIIARSDLLMQKTTLDHDYSSSLA